MDEQSFKNRTRAFGLRVIRVVESLPGNRIADVLSRQLLRSGTSVGANYRAACRARSRAEMASRLAIVEEEADESIYWLEMLIDAGLIGSRRLKSLIAEGNEILSMTVASIRTLRSRGKSTQSKIPNPKSKIA